MPGAKQYDRTDLLDRAIEMFREKGYSGTSTTDLVDGLGVNRKSMYAEFGSKQGLFEAALERYSSRNLTAVLASIEDPDAGADAIRKAFAGYASAIDGRFRGLGCLMCNTAVERAALDAASGQFVAAYLERLNRAFRRALTNAREAGEVAKGVDLDGLAAFFAMSVVGISALIRAQAPSDEVHAAARAAVSLLDCR